MHPEIVQDHPGDCPICGMHLVEKKEAPRPKNGTAGVTVDAATTQKLGVRLIPAKMATLERKIKTYGVVTLDETSIITITPRVDGWIKKLHANAPGKPVKAKGVIYEIYSPELVQRQREYIEIMIRKDQFADTIKDFTGQNAEMMASLAREQWRAREKLALAGMDEPTLKTLEEKRRPIEVTPVRSEKAGVVTAVNAREGAYVNPMSPIATMADLSKLWVDVIIYRDQLEWIEEGAEADIKTAGSGKPCAAGHVSFANPTADQASQAIKARVEIKGAQAMLKPGMQVDVFVHSKPRMALTVPSSAVIRDGKGARVMVSKGNGLFVPAPVVTGVTGGENVEITDGLAAGDMVAANGQFLLDSAASINAAAERMRSGQ